MRLLVTVTVLLLFAGAASALEIPWETQTGFLRSGSFAWTYSYDIGFFGGTLMVDVDIALNGADRGSRSGSRIGASGASAAPISVRSATSTWWRSRA